MNIDLANKVKKWSKFILIVLLTLFVLVISIIENYYLATMSIVIVSLWCALSIAAFFSRSNLLYKCSYLGTLFLLLNSLFFIVESIMLSSVLKPSTLSFAKDIVSLALLLPLIVLMIKDFKKKKDVEENEHDYFMKINSIMIPLSLLLLFISGIIPYKAGSGEVIFSPAVPFVLLLISGYFLVPLGLWINLIVFEVCYHRQNAQNIIATNHIKYLVLPPILSLLVYLSVVLFASFFSIGGLISDIFTNGDNLKVMILLLAFGRPKSLSFNDYEQMTIDVFYLALAIFVLIMIVLITIDLLFDKRNGIYIFALSLASLIAVIFNEQQVVIIVGLSLIALYYLFFEIKSFEHYEKVFHRNNLIIISVIYSLLIAQVALAVLLLPSYPANYSDFNAYQNISYDIFFRGYDNIIPSIPHTLMYVLLPIFVYQIVGLFIKTKKDKIAE